MEEVTIKIVDKNMNNKMYDHASNNDDRILGRKSLVDNGDIVPREEEEGRAELKSLLLPWASVIVFALAASLVVSIYPDCVSSTTTSLSEHKDPVLLGNINDIRMELLASPMDTNGSESNSRILLDVLEDEDEFEEEKKNHHQQEEQEEKEQQEEQREHEGKDFESSSQSQYQSHHPEFHESLFPLTKSDIWGFSLATIGLMLAAGGGIGGGGILVPIYILVMGFTPKHAIPLSNVTVFGGAIANTYLNQKKRHPLANRPLVDWDLILVMEPLTIAGALLGALLNKVLPEAFLTIMLVLLLSFTAHKTLTKAFKMYQTETKQNRINSNNDSNTLVKVTTGTEITTTTTTPFIKETQLTRMVQDTDQQQHHSANVSLLKDVENMEATQQEHKEYTTTTDDDENNDDEMADDHILDNEGNVDDNYYSKDAIALRQILKEEEKAPIPKIMVLVTMFIVVLIVNILKGGGAFPSPVGIRCGSNSFWVANFFMLAWIFLISGFVRSYLQNRYLIKKRIGYEYVAGDIQWDSRATIVYPCICSAAGFFAGMFGIGGGIVKGPLMLAMGVHPAVSSASSACMILFTSFTATTSFVVFGLLITDYAVICLVLGFLATIVGQLGLNYLMKKYQRNSYIAFSIGIVVLLSAFLMTIQSLLSMAEGINHSSGGICGKYE